MAPATHLPGLLTRPAARVLWIADRLVPAAIVALGLLVCAEWLVLALGSRIRQPVAGEAPMVFNAAVLFVVTGISAWPGSPPAVRRWGSVLCLLLAGTTLLQYLTQVDLGIDRLLGRVGDWPYLSSSGRMAPNTATAFLAASGTLLALDRRASGIAPVLAALVLALGLVPLLSLAAGPGRGTLTVLTPMAPHTALALLALGAVLLARAVRQQHATRARAMPWLGAVCCIAFAVVALTGWLAMMGELQRQWQTSVERRALSRAEMLAARVELYAAGLARLADAYASGLAEPGVLWAHDSAFILHLLPRGAGLLLLSGNGEALEQAGVARPLPAALGPLVAPQPEHATALRHAVHGFVDGDTLWVRVAIRDDEGRSWFALLHCAIESFAQEEIGRSRRQGLEMNVEPVTLPAPGYIDGTASVIAPAPLQGLRIRLRDLQSMPGTSLVTLLLAGSMAFAVLIGALVTQMQRQRVVRLRLEELGAQLEHANEELRELAGTDPLTGASNRRRFEQQVAGELAALARAPGELGLLLFDIDHFKRVNDTHGHTAGDVALRELVAALNPLLRPRDLLARVGGEEFAVLLPGSGRAASHEVAERLCAAARATAIELPEATLRLTISIGVACSPADGSTLGELQARADQRLYAAKRGGRDRVVDGDA